MAEQSVPTQPAQSTPSAPPKKGKSAACIIVTILGVIVLIYFVLNILSFFAPIGPLNALLVKVSKKKPEVMTPVPKKGTTEIPTKAADSALIGNWESDCLVPDQKSPWSEKHTFVIEGSTAIHTRVSNDTPSHDCSPTMTLTDTYEYTIPEKGKINLKDTSKGVTFYDIYQVNGDTLRFGHGFRNTMPYPANVGASPDSRIESLNEYIIYKKVK